MKQLDEVDAPFMSKTELRSSDARYGRFCEWESRERKDNLKRDPAELGPSTKSLHRVGVRETSEKNSSKD